MVESIQYLPPHRRDTRYPLWHDRYLVKVATIQTRSVDDVLENGFYISGEEAFDHDSNWRREQRFATVTQMAAWWHSGANVFLVNDKDSETIYKDITSHLVEWRQILRGAYNTVIKPPAKDLLILDEFAGVVYEHAKYVFDDSDKNSAFFKGHKMLRFSRRAENDLMARLVQEREEREQREASKKGEYHADNVKVHVVNVGEERVQQDSDFSNRARFDNGRRHKSILDFLDPTKRPKD